MTRRTRRRVRRTLTYFAGMHNWTWFAARGLHHVNPGYISEVKTDGVRIPRSLQRLAEAK